MNPLSTLKPSAGRDVLYPQFRFLISVPSEVELVTVSEQTKTVLAASSQASSNETPM